MCGSSRLRRTLRARHRSGGSSRARCRCVTGVRMRSVNGRRTVSFWGIAACRSSICNTGQQPMHSSDGRYVIIFNGEIYNFRELRHELEARRRTLPHPIRHRSHPRGLPAVGRGRRRAAERDVRVRHLGPPWRSRAFVARDRLGIKPLRWAMHGRCADRLVDRWSRSPSSDVLTNWIRWRSAT